MCIACSFGFLIDILWRLFLKPTRLNSKIETQAAQWHCSSPSSETAQFELLHAPINFAINSRSIPEPFIGLCYHVRRTTHLHLEKITRNLNFYWVASMANPVGICVSFVFCFFIIFLFIYIFFSLSVKVLPVTPLLSGVFVHRAFCAHFLRIERVVGNGVDFSGGYSRTINLTGNGVESHVTRMAF